MDKPVDEWLAEHRHLQYLRSAAHSEARPRSLRRRRRTKRLPEGYVDHRWQKLRSAKPPGSS